MVFHVKLCVFVDVKIFLGNSFENLHFLLVLSIRYRMEICIYYQ